MSSPITMAQKAPRSPKDQVLNRGAWTAKEDKLLSEYVKLYGETGWPSVPRKTGLKRCGKSCRLRWMNYLRPDIKRGNISSDEEELIVRLHGLLGNRWSLIAGRLPGRTDNEIKNYWNTHLSKKRLSNDNSLPKPKPNKKSKSAPPATHGFLKVTPVKVKAVRIENGCNKYVDRGGSNHQTTDPAQTVKASRSYSDLLAEELMREHNSDIIDFTMATELESPSVEINGQYFPEDFGIEELPASPCGDYLEMSFLSNYIEQVENSTDGGYNGMEGLCSSTQRGDWMDELQYFQMSSLLPSESHEEDFTQFS